jgi:hypothetical protein
LLLFFEKNNSVLLETPAEVMYTAAVLGRSPQFPYIGAKHTVETNTWSFHNACTAFVRDLHRGDSTRLDILLACRTLSEAEVGLNNFTGMKGELSFTHAFEYLQIIDRKVGDRYRGVCVSLCVLVCGRGRDEH